MLKENTTARRLAQLHLAVALVFIPNLATATDVLGTLTLPESVRYDDPLPTCQQRHCFWDERNGIVPTQRLSRDLSQNIAVVAIGRSSDTTPKNFELHLKGGGVEPSTLVATVGGTLRVSNDDAFARKPFISNHKEMNGTSMAARTARSLKLLETGVQQVSDQSMPQAKGYLHVISELAAVASVSSGGGFRFSGLKSGNYTLHVYFQDQLLYKQTMSVPTRGVLRLDPIEVTEAGKKK